MAVRMRGLHYGNSLCFGGSSIEVAVIRKNIYLRENFINEGLNPHNSSIYRSSFSILDVFTQQPNFVKNNLYTPTLSTTT